jgi:hypothetical protein
MSRLRHLLKFDRNRHGQLKWQAESHNMVFEAGINHMLDVVFHGGSQVSPWYLGLVSDDPTFAAADTMTSHSGWAENTAYTGNRKEYVENAPSNKAIDNAGSEAVFAIDDTTVIAGAFLCSGATGTSCILLCGAVFDQRDRAVVSGDTLNVTYNFEGADDGA